MRVERAGILLLLLGVGCAHSPAEDSTIARRSSKTPPSSWVPPGAIHVADLTGLEGRRGLTGTTALDLSFFDHVEEDEPEGGAPTRVSPILAATGTVVTFDIPMSDDERVEEWIEYLTSRGRRWYAKWLGRSTRYVPIFWEILDRHALPRDLVFLAMIESGFSPRAYSWAHAAGPWQFMPRTGRQYGLRVGFWVDERRDFELATEAAARYLSRLYDYYEGDWYLAWAAYNGGVVRINRAVRRLRTRDFWRLSRTWHLRRETRHYVPKLLAAARIAKQPDKYGFADVDYMAPLSWEVLTVTVATDLKTIAKACRLDDRTELVTLNPALRVEVTPPGVGYPLRVPEGMAERCSEGLSGMLPSERMTYRYYEVRRRDSLVDLAKRFSTTPEAILSFNGISREQLHDFEELVVPLPLEASASVPIVEPPTRKYRPNVYGPEGARKIVYVVRPGDSLWRIARRFRVSLKKLRLWNGLWKRSRLQVGQRLRLYVGRGRAPR